MIAPQRAPKNNSETNIRKPKELAGLWRFRPAVGLLPRRCACGGCGTRATSGALPAMRIEARLHMLLGAAAARCTEYRSHTLRAVRFLRSAQAVAMPVSMQFNAGSIHASPGGQPPLSSAAARHTLLHNRFRAEDEGHPANGGGARGRDCASRIWATTGVRWRLQTSIDVGDGGWMMLGGHSQIRGDSGAACTHSHRLATLAAYTSAGAISLLTRSLRLSSPARSQARGPR